MRALGTTRKVAAQSLLLPLTVVSVAAVLVGSAVGWIYTVITVAHNNTLSLMQTYAISTSVPAGAALGCILGEIILTLLIAVLMLRRIGARSPLALLQDNKNGKARAKVKASGEKPAGPDTNMLPAAPSASPIPPPAQAAAPMVTAVASDVHRPGSRQDHRSGSVGFVLRYIGRHMRRSAGKSALAVLLAALLFAAVGQFALIRQSYTELCTDTVIKANFIGGLELGVVQSIISTDYVTDSYYEVSPTVDLNNITTKLAVTNNIARYIGEDPTITYADGYDASAINQRGYVVLIGKTFMELYGLELGGTVQLSSVRLFEKYRPIISTNTGRSIRRKSLATRRLPRWSASWLWNGTTRSRTYSRLPVSSRRCPASTRI
jgi:hypothetical protein